MTSDIALAIIAREFKRRGLPRPVIVIYAVDYDGGEIWTATAGVLRVRKFAVYVRDGMVMNLTERAE